MISSRTRLCASMHLWCWQRLMSFVSATLQFVAGIWASSVRRASRGYRSTPDWWDYLHGPKGHNTNTAFSIISHSVSLSVIDESVLCSQKSWPTTLKYLVWCSCAMVMCDRQLGSGQYLVSDRIKAPGRARGRWTTEWNERHWLNLLMFRVYWQISGALTGRAFRQVAVMSLIGLCGVKLCSLCARGRHKNPCEHA